LQRAGWRQHEYGPPTGHPDRLQAWTGASTMNRYVDLALSGLDDWFDGAQVDLAILVAEDETARAVAETLADLVVAPGYWLSDPLRARLETGFGAHGPLDRPIRDLIGLSDLMKGRFWSDADNALRDYAPTVPYPEGNPASPPLMTVAQTIKEDLGLRVATVDVPGWDTHVNQAPQFADLTGRLSQALLAFWRELGPWQQDVSVVVMSEFGRRLRSNTGGGTDHGRGNVMMVLGPQAKGGRMVGRWPGLANEALEEGADLAVVTDYRDVLAELLYGHMRLADSGAVFPGYKAAPVGLWG
jgi:hypothetical protein